MATASSEHASDVQLKAKDANVRCNKNEQLAVQFGVPSQNWTTPEHQPSVDDVCD